MRYLLCNGSPKGSTGNTARILDALAEGISSAPGQHIIRANLNRVQEHESVVSTLLESEVIIIAFPLYTDAMPGITMAFIEALRPHIDRFETHTFCFIVQSGFPERIHCEPVEKYLVRLTEILGAKYGGTLILGGGMMMNPKRFQIVNHIGARLSDTHIFDETCIKKATPLIRFPVVSRGIISLATKLPIAQSFWDSQLRANGAYERRFDHPYESKG